MASFSISSRTDDKGESERSLSSSYLPFSLLGGYGVDLPLRRSRCSCFLVTHEHTDCQQGPGAAIPHDGNFDLLDEGLVVNCESSMQTDLPFFTRVRGLDKTTYVSPFTWCCTWLHNGVGPGGTGKLVFANPSSIMPMGRGSLPDWRRHTAPLKSSATMSTCSCNITVRTVSINFFPIPRFLA